MFYLDTFQSSLEVAVCGIITNIGRSMSSWATVFMPKHRGADVRCVKCNERRVVQIGVKCATFGLSSTARLHRSAAPCTYTSLEVIEIFLLLARRAVFALGFCRWSNLKQVHVAILLENVCSPIYCTWSAHSVKEFKSLYFGLVEV